MSMRCKSSTHGVYHGAITVPMYQGNNITGGLNTVMSYVSLSSDPLQGYFVRLNLRTKCALSVRITDDVCTYLASFVRSKGTIQWRRAGVVCPAGCVDNGGFVPS